MAISKRSKQRTSEQIQQLRFEIASAKCQANLTSEIDDFLKNESERTIQTFSGEESNSDFSAGSFTRRSIKSSSTRSVATSSSSLRSIPQVHQESGESSPRRSHPQPPMEILLDVERKPLIRRLVTDDNLVLYNMCEQGQFVSVRAWLDGKSNDTVKKAILATKDSTMTAFHMLCSKNPPLYLVYRFAMTAPEACKISDFAGRLPIHHAIISGAESRVIDVLVKAYPDSLMVEDKTGLLPMNRTGLAGPMQK